MKFLTPPPQSEIENLPEPVHGTVDETISPNQPGRVKAMGSYWPAELYYSEDPLRLYPGEPVLVVAIKNITLLVVQL